MGAPYAIPDEEELNPVTGQPVVPRGVVSRRREELDPLPVVGCYFTDDGHALGHPADGGLRLVDELLVEAFKSAPGPMILATTQPARAWHFLEAHATAAYRAHGNLRLTRPFLANGEMGGVVQERATFAGFAWGRKSAAHLVLDPAAWTDEEWWRVLGLSRREEHPWAVARELASWGADVASWCAERGYRPRASRGGISAQMLRDARWFPERRRKVPRMVNEAVRPHLPGNHYVLAEGAAGVHPQATEVDLRGAHHQAARAVQFTDPDDLYIRGPFLRETPGPRDGWRPGDEGYDELLSWHGLLRMEVEVPAGAQEHPDLPPPGCSGEAYVWSVDVPDLAAEGVKVTRIIGGALSSTSSDALNRYGAWSRDELEAATPARRRWLKPLLLSFYGLLAQTPQPFGGFTWHPTAKGTRRGVVLGAEMVDAFVHEAPQRAEAGYVNVADRGLIEAWTRGTIRRAARVMQERHRDALVDEHEESVELLAIRADSLIVTGDPADARSWAETMLAAMPELEWRDTPLTNLHLHSATHFEANETAKLPGVPRVSRPDREEGPVVTTAAPARVTLEEALAAILEVFPGAELEPDDNEPEMPPGEPLSGPWTDWRELQMEMVP